MYNFEEIRHLHIEPTTRCNAACPMCARNVFGRKIPGLDLTELSLNDLASMFAPSFLNDLEGIDLCGAYGDPILTRELPDMLRYLRKYSKSPITIYTNGGVRDKDWWRKLASILGTPSKVVFAIDGLSDTNSIHRRNVKFETVISNAKAFIMAGGIARWEYIAFKHNEHQIQEALTLSEKMGFQEFSVKRSNRFLDPFYEHVPEIKSEYHLFKFPVYDHNGSCVGTLEPPKNDQYVNPSLRKLPDQLKKWGALEELFDVTAIKCRVKGSSSIFLSASGHIFPCCWTYVQATRPRYLNLEAEADLSVHQMVLESGGYESLDLRQKSLQVALESRFFSAIEASWDCSSIQKGRLKVCARSCGTEFSAYFDQFVNRKFLPRGLNNDSLTENTIEIL